jgi:hypothetical protein
MSDHSNVFHDHANILPPEYYSTSAPQVEGSLTASQERYWPVTVGSTNIYTCRRCGLLTADPMLHDRWHSSSWPRLSAAVPVKENPDE